MLVRLEEDQPLVLLTEHLSGKHDQKSHAPGGAKGATSSVPPRAASGPAATANFINAQAERFRAAGGTIEVVDSMDMLIEDRQRIDTLTDMLQGETYERKTAGASRAIFGTQMTSAALAPPHAGSQRLIARAPNGDVAGAVSYVKSPDSPAIKIDFLGSTGIMPGTGSALMAPIIKDAAASGRGLGGMSAATARPMWNRLGSVNMVEIAAHGALPGVLPGGRPPGSSGVLTLLRTAARFTDSGMPEGVFPDVVARHCGGTEVTLLIPDDPGDWDPDEPYIREWWLEQQKLGEATWVRHPKGNPKGGQFAPKKGAGGGTAPSTPGGEDALSGWTTDSNQKMAAYLGVNDFSYPDEGAAAAAYKRVGVEAVGKRLHDDPAWQEATKQGSALESEVRGQAFPGVGAGPEYRAGQFVDGAQRNWAETSGDNSPTAIAMQVAAKRSVAPDGEISHFPESQNPGAYDRSGGYAAGEAYHRARYADTQASLAAAGFKPTDTVTLYRGTGRWEPEDGGGGDSELRVGSERTASGTGNTATISTSPLSSWTTNRDTALAFGDDLMVADFPISRIYGTSNRGAGQHAESEVIVIGGSADQVTFGPSYKYE